MENPIIITSRPDFTLPERGEVRITFEGYWDSFSTVMNVRRAEKLVECLTKAIELAKNPGCKETRLEVETC